MIEKMALYFSYVWIWKWVAVDGSLLQNYYWEDFNPTNADRPDSWETATAYNETYSYDLSGFQPGHEVAACVCNIKNGGSSSRTQTVTATLQRSTNGNSWTNCWSFDFGSATCDTDEVYAMYVYFWVDFDEIWEWYTKYRVKWSMSDDSATSSTMTVSNLSFDSSQHTPWYLWVEWNHLCYIDATYSTSYGYKHSIAYDSSYSDYVWSSYAGAIRLESNDYYRIYYVDQTWTKRRTYSSRAWYDGNVNVWTSNRWYMRVGYGDAEDGYGHLCFVAPNGSKRRILNWPPEWYS